MLHIGVSAWYIALNRMLFSLWAVSASSNFSVADLASKQSTQRAIFLFCSNLSTRGWLLCASCNSPVGFGCMWALFVAPWCLCYRTSKSRLSDHGFQQSATCRCGTHYNRRELTEPMTDVNYSPYPKIGLCGLVMAHGHWINRCIDPSCMFYEFGIFCLSDTTNFGVLVPIWTCEYALENLRVYSK